jgi:hypothetical protein
MQVLNAGWSAPFNITESAIDLAITAQKIKKDQQMKMVLLLLKVMEQVPSYQYLLDTVLPA